MAGLRSIAIRWYRKAFGAPAGSDIREEGLDTVLDGNSAVALAEAGIASHAVLGGSPPMTDADSVWRDQFDHGATNSFGETLSADSAEGPRGIVAAATGLALAGRRATAFLSGPDIAAAQDLLISAAGKHAPLVLHLGTRAAAAHGGASGSGHDTVHLSADSGFFLLFAANVQEAVDFTYVARRVAEEALVPGLVVMDGEQTALAPQDVRLLSPAQVRACLDPARDTITAPTEAQKLLFGETRRRVPAWHDLDEPVLTGAIFDRQSFALGAFAQKPFFDDFVAESLAAAFELLERKTGRHSGSISEHRLADAEVVLVAMGAAIETARVAADRLRKQHKLRAGVLGIHSLRPFPSEALARALAGRERVFVLERAVGAMSGEPPLTREVRASFGRLERGEIPLCAAAVYGVGGLPLAAADIVELCTTSGLPAASPRFLGVAFDDPSGTQPKREVLLDALRRAYPDAAALGICADQSAAVPNQGGTLTVAIHRGRNQDKGLLEAAAALLHALEPGRIRSRLAIASNRDAGRFVDWLVHGDDSLQDPGDALTADVTLDLQSGTLTLGGSGEVFRVPAADDHEQSLEASLGALFGVLTGRGLFEARRRSVVGARKRLLDNVAEPPREALLAAFEAGLDEAAELEPAGVAPAQQAWEGGTPAAVRHLGRDDDHFASLPRFWDQAGVLYRDGMANRLTADPYLATGTLPPLSSTFSDLSHGRTALPAFDPALCTGCGRCWTHCPDSAIGVTAAAPAALIDAGIRQTGAEPVRQVAAKLAARMIAIGRKAESPAVTFGGMLDESLAWLMEKAPLPDERKQAIEDGVGRIKAAFGAVPVALTKPFFQDAEAQKKDSGELLSLAINPDACKACGICIDSCGPGALTLQEQDAEVLHRARDLWSTWTSTPDTAAATVERVAQDPEIGAMAAMLLSRYCQFAMAGGDPAEAGSGEKIAVRLALSATEFHQQPIVQRFAKTLDEASEAISDLIRDTLSGTLAVEDLDAVMEKLQRTTSPRVDLSTLAESAGEAAGAHSVDTRYLLRLLDLSKRLSSAHHRLVSGEHGLGRARYGLAVAGGSTAEWAGAFPHNPFQAPVSVDMSGDAAQLAVGLVEGHLDETTELVRLLRLARLEVERPDGIDWQREALAGLRWQDLGDEEYDLCPPLVLIGSDEMLAGRGLGQLMWLLNSGLPVKALVLSALEFGLVETKTNDPRAGLGLLALAQRNAYVAQCSIARPAHFAESLLDALRYDGPALIQVYAPSPARHGFASDRSLEQAQLAVASRALPLFRYDPEGDGVFGSRISLGGNPQTEASLAEDGGKLLTLADWALAQARFASNFTPLAADAPAPLPLDEWLELEPGGRRAKTPYVTTGDGDDERRYSMTPAMAAAAGQCLQSWRTLQELAGIVTPFTERLEQDIRATVAAEHQAELDAQQQAAAAELLEVRKTTQAEIAGKIRSRLLELASRKRN